MKKLRIPTNWLHMHGGDQVASRLPLHRIESMISQLADDGWKLRTDPYEYGYWIVCEASPNDSCHPAAVTARGFFCDSEDAA